MHGSKWSINSARTRTVKLKCLQIIPVLLSRVALQPGQTLVREPDPTLLTFFMRDLTPLVGFSSVCNARI